MALASGLGQAAAAAVLFGVQYVPVKKYKIYDGTTFQWFMCSGILMMGFLIALVRGEVQNGLPPLVILGGVMWALSNFLVLWLVKLLGIGLGFSLYHFVNLVVGYATGRFGLFGVAKMGGDLAVCDFGCCLILVSFFVMVFVEGGADTHAPAREPPLPAPTARSPSDPLLRGGCVAMGNTLALPLSPVAPAQGARVLAQDDQEAAARTASASTVGSGASAGPGRTRLLNRLVGVVLAIVGGGLCGVQSVPATLYNAEHPGNRPTAVVLPQCFGIWVASTAIYNVYASLARLAGVPVPHAVIRPAYFSGCIWALGFACMIGGIHELGYSIGYTLDAVGPIVVSSLISVFVFREITGEKQLKLFACAFLCQLVGVVLIAAFGHPAG